jgi:3-hydroxybutyryl-CoA dehydrogenase
MGAGIAALAVRCGVSTILYDVADEPLERGLGRIRESHERQLRRTGPDAEQLERWQELLTATTRLADLGSCGLVLEAAPESASIKGQLLADLAAIAPAATLASNTSSIRISELAERSGAAERVLGLHFFNPPERMRLVELVSTGLVSGEHLDRAREFATTLGKHVVSVTDGPGFLVNRCARPYYLEALRIVEDGAATIAEVDRACVEQGGFPLGPFELMDLVGIDINLAATRSMYEQADGEPRWRPSALQRAMVASGRLGRKAGAGFYAQDCSWRNEPAGAPEAGSTLLERIVAQLVNEAAFTAAEGIATPADIDQAMMIGLNHPRGPFEWARALGPERVVAILDELWAHEHDQRYRVAPALRRLAVEPAQRRVAVDQSLPEGSSP